MPSAKPPMHQTELQLLTLNKTQADKENTSSTAKLGQWLNATQSGVLDQEQITDENKTDDSSITELTLHELPVEPDDGGHASTLNTSRINGQQAPNSFYPRI